MSGDNGWSVWELAADLVAGGDRPVSWLAYLRSAGYGMGLESEDQARDRAREMAESVLRVSHAQLSRLVPGSADYEEVVRMGQVAEAVLAAPEIRRSSRRLY